MTRRFEGRRWARRFAMADRSIALGTALAIVLAGVAQAADQRVLEAGWRASGDLQDLVPERAMRMGVSG